jgi:hypothetical protein
MVVWTGNGLSLKKRPQALRLDGLAGPPTSRATIIRPRLDEIVQHEWQVLGSSTTRRIAD